MFFKSAGIENNKFWIVYGEVCNVFVFKKRVEDVIDSFVYVCVLVFLLYMDVKKNVSFMCRLFNKIIEIVKKLSFLVIELFY